MSKQRIVATIYDKKGNLLATGHNSYTKTHPRQAHFARLAGNERKTYLHAEIAAIINAGRQLVSLRKLHSIRVERRNAAGELKLAKPCAICMLAIRASGIKEVSYSVSS